MVLTDDLKDNHAPVVLEVLSATLGTKQRNKMNNTLKKKQRESIIKVVVSLLNSGGGVVKIGIVNKNYNYKEDGIASDLETSFSENIPFVSKYLSFKQQENYFLIFVKPWNLGNSFLPIATVKTNLYKRDLSSTNMMNNTVALEFLLEKKKSGGHIIPKTPKTIHGELLGEDTIEASAAATFSKTQLQYGEKLTFTESTHAEMKCFKTEKSFQRIKEILPQYVSAFANTDGGYLFIGIDDNRQVTGIELNDTIESLEKGIKKCIEKLPVHHFCKKMKKIEYTCKFQKVGGDEHPNKYVIALRIEKFCCAVFAKEPDSWYVEDNREKQFSVEEWVNRMVNGKQGEKGGLE
ncbi:ribonuclease SLFN12 [Sorex araneus]|uniref:ribonuclease SLFN12 n=1 Tax=Sorex araneus TaxID=42254 RepID=UPI00243386EF|nr:ribonuclease SLFN12 [Sorex araneus]